ncbi:MAG: DUF763 domain-containing protein [Myxococcales bacterium FL481]|nr:MAG: DUF763 domain-containing protein [Myxococcales bacterium FL481]
MGRATGTADLPLHGGRVPAWLGIRMQRLGRVVVEAIVLEYGRDEVLRRLAHPFWFQSFGAVMGMDWHSSGITTSVVGALKRGLAPVASELGLWVCGGRGKQSRKTPAELVAVGERTGQDGEAWARTSRLVAKVDSAAVQDGFDLYLHGMVVAADGRWAVVQQGMNGASRRARRYHWLSEGLRSFIEAPHAAIDGEPAAEILNLTDRRAARSRDAQLDLVRGPVSRVLETLRRRRERPQPSLVLPHHHDVRPSDVVLRRLEATLRAAQERGPRDFAELLALPGVGARTVAALAHVSTVIHGAPHRFSDPARYSMALGGKDGHPFPVPLTVYDRTITTLRRAVDRARLGQRDHLSAVRALDRQARMLESASQGLSFAAFLARERAQSPRYAGRTVFGPATTAEEPLVSSTQPKRRSIPAGEQPSQGRDGPRASGRHRRRTGTPSRKQEPAVDDSPTQLALPFRPG